MSVLEELNDLRDRKIRIEMYMLATSEKHNCWYVNLPNAQYQMCYKTCDQRTVVSIEHLCTAVNSDHTAPATGAGSSTK